MAPFTSIAAAVRTRRGRFSGTRHPPYLIVNQAGHDCVSGPMVSAQTVGSVRRGQSLYYYDSLPRPGLPDIDDQPASLAATSVRLATASTDLWEPELALVWGQSRRSGIVPLAFDLDLKSGLSADHSEGRVSVAVRRVHPGDDGTPIRRLVLILLTFDAPYAGTDAPIFLRVSTPSGEAVHHVISDTPQTDLEIDTANIYEVPVKSPFTKLDLLRSGPRTVSLGLHGTDKWVPKKILLFGLESQADSPERVVPLVDLREPGPVSADPRKGVPSLDLTVISGR